MKLMLVILTLFAATSTAADTIRIAVTTSFHNSGLSDILLPEIKNDLGLDVHLLVVGTGQAIRLGQAGDVDAILVHSRKAEDTFVAEKHGTHRREIMYNDFVIIGPNYDPAGIRTAKSVQSAFTAIASTQSPFVSRGDDSGTNKMELSLWMDAGVDAPMDEANWYKESGSGMGATLNIASGMNAYALTDRASWLKFGNKGDLVLLFSGDPTLFNQYAFLPVSPQKHPHVNAQSSAALETWLTSDHARELINGYTLNGETLFTFNATK